MCSNEEGIGVSLLLCYQVPGPAVSGAARAGRATVGSDLYFVISDDDWGGGVRRSHEWALRSVVRRCIRG